MNQKSYLILDNEFIKYCELNDIKNPEQFAQEVFKKGFNIVKYGSVPTGFKGGEKIIEKEIIKEIIKEIPVEKIIEKPIEVIKEIIKEIPVEVIKEVPIEIKGDTQIVIQEVIKEVPVEKIVEVTNETEITALRSENDKLKIELDNLKTSLESLGRKGKFMKDSNLSSLYDE